MALNLTEILVMDHGPRRTAALAQWVQELYPGGKVRPVLVGGAAVELLTGGAYTTGDLDLVGSVPAAVSSALKRAGFTREGRHWYHDQGRIFLDFPSAVLRVGEESRERVFGDFTVSVISAEDLIVNRLAEWLYWGSAVDGVNAFLLYRAVEAELDLRKLEERAARENVRDALVAVKDLYIEHAGAVPEDKVIEKWAMEVPQ